MLHHHGFQDGQILEVAEDPANGHQDQLYRRSGEDQPDGELRYRKLKVWYLPDGIANFFSMHELEKLYHITYNSWEGY